MNYVFRSESSDAREQESRNGDNIFGRRGRGFDSLLIVVGVIQRPQQPHPDELLADKVRRESGQHRRNQGLELTGAQHSDRTHRFVIIFYSQYSL